MPDITPDAVTRRWLRGPADERAAANGCRFDEERGRFAVDWIQDYCRLYEGDWAGQPMKLVDWQLECTMRLFGWVRWSKKWEREVRRFRRASIWIAKKNKKSPTLAAWGLYLLCGDSEEGQKIFLAAKDGQQARNIAGEHIKAMYEQSPELKAECTFNRATYRISHTASRSWLEPLSSDNIRSQKSKEGLNGSVLTDETHVVDRDFAARVSRAGISRSEPLHIEVSTAGNDPDSYGKEQFDHALAVQEGTATDEQLLAVVYACPQTLSDTDLDADPLKWGRLANPSMGHTIDPEEYLTDYAQSKRSLRSLLDFKMYRLNIWQRSASPWLKAGDWDLCRRDYTEADLEGHECCAGLDLSKTQDMSSLVLVFPWEDETYRLLAYFWLPEEVAKEKGHLAAFQEWARAGFLTLTPGNVIDYGFIRAQFRKLAEKFVIRKLAYDKTYAEETTQALSEGVMDDAGKEIEAGTGVERVIFPQTLMAFTAPCKDFERLVISQKLHHNGNPILSWQAGHVQVRADSNQNIRPVKPKPNDIKKIDGVVAAVMGLSQAMLPQEAEVTVEVW